jgi:hypothetical protein
VGLEIFEKCEYICALICSGKWPYVPFDLKGRKMTKRRGGMDISMYKIKPKTPRF